MKLSSVAVDPKAIEDGEWVKDLARDGRSRIEVPRPEQRGVARLFRKRINALPRNLRNRPDGLPIAVRTRSTTSASSMPACLDWKNLELDDGPRTTARSLLRS
jgi:hypothetical protein